MDDKLRGAYEALETPNKRQELNTEMKYAFEYIRNIKANLGMTTRINQLLDYNKFDNADYSEDMMLNLLYENFFNIEKELIDIAKSIGTIPVSK